MKCKDCGSRKINWEINSGYVVITYNEQGEEIDRDFVCESLVAPDCEECQSTNLTRG